MKWSEMTCSLVGGRSTSRYSVYMYSVWRGLWCGVRCEVWSGGVVGVVWLVRCGRSDVVGMACDGVWCV